MLQTNFKLRAQSVWRRSTQQRREAMYKKILIPTDGLSAFRHGNRAGWSTLAKSTGATVMG
jgi:hypothetical protein